MGWGLGGQGGGGTTNTKDLWKATSGSAEDMAQ